MKIRKLLTILLVLSMLTALLGGCGSDGGLMSAEKNAVGYYDAAEGETVALADEALSSGTQTSQGNLPANQKLIRTVTLEAETNAMDTLIADVEGRVNQLGGYIENRSIYNGKTTLRDNRWADLTIRIPADKLDQFVSQVSGVSNVVSHNENTKDVTLNYVATESRIKALETEEARLLELLAVAKDLKDLLTLEEKLTDVRTELEQYKSQLKVYDNQVNYATVRLSLREVVEFTEVEEPEPEPTFWERLWNGFTGSLKNTWTLFKGFVILVVSAIPYLIVPGCIVAIILVSHGIRRRKAKKKETPQA